MSYAVLITFKSPETVALRSRPAASNADRNSFIEIENIIVFFYFTSMFSFI